jgi:hypothetical protein
MMDEVTALSVSETGKLLALGIEKNLDVDKLKALMDLRDREDRRRAERDFEDHFALMQKDYIPAFKSKDVKTLAGGIAYSYCPLPLILSVYAPILARHGFSYRWEEDEIDGKSEKKETCFLSGYGFTRQASISLPYGEQNKLINSIQARGVTSEYGRRYTFMNVTGCIVADEMDTDGRVEHTEATEYPPQSTKPTSTETNHPVATSGPVCTACGKPLLKSKPEYGGGWYCYAKKGGCGKKFTDEEIKNPKEQEKPVEQKTGAPVVYPKLMDDTISQAVTLMDEMGWDNVIQLARFQWGESVGDKMFLDKLQADYQEFLNQKK